MPSDPVDEGESSVEEDMYAETTSTPTQLDTSPEAMGTSIPPGSLAEQGDDAPPPKDDAANAPTETEASQIAVSNGHNVVVDSATTETTLTEALPDGTFQLTSSAVPVRVEREGSWIDIDTTLAKVGEFFTPAATTTPVRFSDGGAGPIAQIQLPTGDWFSESLEFDALPAPMIEGSVATYANVIPDVDLRLTATSTGMTEVLVVKTPEAASDPRLEELKIQVNGALVATSADGGTVAAPTDTDSIEAGSRGAEPMIDDIDVSEMLRSNEPVAWDSSDPTSGPAGPGGNTLAAPVDATVKGQDTLTIDVASLIEDQPVVYPLYIDPDWGRGNIQAWSINHTYPDQHCWNVPDASDGRGNQVVGYLPAGWTLPYPGDSLEQWGRSFWQMDTSGSAGKHILNARFNVRQSWNSSCASTSMRLFRATNIPSAGASWNESVGVVYNGPSDVVSTNFGSNCAGQNWVGMNATQAVIGNGTGQAIILALAASDETHESWKRFNLDATLVITYNSVPKLPTSLQMTSPPRSCGSSTNPVYINPALPFTIGATISDDDPVTLEGRFRVMPSNNGSLNAIPSIAPNGYLSGGNHASGSFQSVDIPGGVLADGSYVWSVSGVDTYSLPGGGTGHDQSAESWCYFVAKSTVPHLPTITKTSTGTATVGKPMTFKLTSLAADKVAGFEYWWDNREGITNTALPVPCGINWAEHDYDPASGCVTNSGGVRVLFADSTGAANITVAPVDESSTLWVASFDKAGNVSRGGTSQSSTDPVAASHNVAGLVADVAAFDFGPGHGWRTARDGTGETDLTSPIPATFPDSNTTTGALPGAAANLTIGPGFPLRAKTDISSSPLPGDEPIRSVFRDVGGVGLFQTFNSGASDHATVSAGQVLSGYVVESQLGQMAPLGVTTANTALLYSCKQSNGNYFTTRSNTCNGAGVTPVKLGYIWTVPPSAPIVAGDANVPYVELFRCTVQTSYGDDHFDSVSPTCNGYGTGASLGYLRNLSAMRTTVATVDTTKSFTVSAWVRPDQPQSLSTYNTIVSQTAGGSDSTFVLQEKAAVNGEPRKYRFCIRTQVANSVTDCATQSGAAEDQEWVFVTGIWDSVNQQIRLVIGSTATPEAVTSHVKPAGETTGTSVLSIGSSITNGCRVNMWRGMIANVTIFPGVVSSYQLDRLSRLRPANP